MLGGVAHLAELKKDYLALMQQTPDRKAFYFNKPKNMEMLDKK